MPPTDPRLAALDFAAAEHVCLEDHEAAIRHGPARVTRRYAAGSAITGHRCELAFDDGDRLHVSIVRPREAERRYAVDLAVLAPVLRVERRFAWGWAVVALLLGAAAVWACGPALEDAVPGAGVTTAALATAAMLAALAQAVIRSRERIEIRTVLGDAPAVRLEGLIGLSFRLRDFGRRLAERAGGNRRPPDPATLRAHMREHYRLRDAGALETGEFDAAKARLLARFD